MQSPLSAEQQIRFQLAGIYKIEDVKKLEEVFQWVMGPKQTILPVSNFEVVKN